MITKKLKIEYTTIAVCFIGTAIVLYFYVFAPQPAPTVVPTATAPTAATQPVSAPSSAPSGGATPVSAPAALPAAGFLPHGTAISTEVLSDPLFTSLIAPVYPKVSKDEVGNSNPFSPPATPGSAQAGK